MIVADTGAVVALIDSNDRHHATLVAAFDASTDEWILPWAVLPEIDYIVSTRVGAYAARAFRADLAAGTFAVEWGTAPDLTRAHGIEERYGDLSLGLVDAVVMAVAERLRARAIATLDYRDFGAVDLEGAPALWPRDL